MILIHADRAQHQPKVQIVQYQMYGVAISIVAIAGSISEALRGIWLL